MESILKPLERMTLAIPVVSLGRVKRILMFVADQVLQVGRAILFQGFQMGHWSY
jgi:hypothetical protein